MSKQDIFKAEVLEALDGTEYSGGYTTDDWEIGYTTYCEDCECIKLHNTGIEIPYDSHDDEEFDAIITEVFSDYTEKAKWLYDNEELMCHCDDDK